MSFRKRFSLFLRALDLVDQNEPPPNDDPARCPITSDGRQCRRRKHPAGESCDFINEERNS